jgi:hypothetical protein
MEKVRRYRDRYHQSIEAILGKCKASMVIAWEYMVNARSDSFLTEKNRPSLFTMAGKLSK